MHKDIIIHRHDNIRIALAEFKQNGIQHTGKGLQKIINYQDLIGHSTHEELRSLWQTLTPMEREIFTWVNFSLLGQETALTVLKETVVKEYIVKERKGMHAEFAEEQAHIEREFSKLHEEKEIFAECKKGIHKRIAKLRHDIKKLKARADNYRTIYTDEAERHQKTMRLLDQAWADGDKWRKLKALISD